ncbi:probable aminopeptidase NPEPL1 [Parasteatoda tepidariorum]|uniref:probable aminopeptidase NPEPL1 n=1 Tax=Parasteatoda tepidariorum TaxID=114398 RepID=UPI00077F90DD|nr:probable aminopeptidase NPEPL1 [Parasteatoda tepidariorum]
MAKVTLKISNELAACDPCDKPILIVGTKTLLSSLSYDTIKNKLQPVVSKEVFESAVEYIQTSSSDSVPLYMRDAVLARLPSSCSRHNTPSQVHYLTKLVKSYSFQSDGYVVMVCEYSNAFPSACAIARAFPLFTKKNGGSPHTVTVEFIILSPDGSKVSPLTDEDLKCLTAAADGIRIASKIVDTPCNDMNTDTFLQEIKLVADKLSAKLEVIQGEELDKRGLGGIYSVGRAAEHPPALAVLSHTPPNAKETIAWVGKGIVYDTGGLCIKSRSSMTGMKRDCGGAAAILGAFYVTVSMGFKENLHAIFCLAENAVGPKSTRPDDIITMYSGKTVEVNNTDAEGRLVLGDGVFYAKKDLCATTILDMATLTGAQGISTGKYHAALLTNSEEWEKATVRAGKNSGDLIHPLPYTPEIHFNEFHSCMADMKNAVADASNAASACAGLFIGSHIGFDFDGNWIHIDMSKVSYSGERATGYGVALLSTLFATASDCQMLQTLAPQFGDEDKSIFQARK